MYCKSFGRIMIVTYVYIRQVEIKNDHMLTYFILLHKLLR